MNERDVSRVLASALDQGLIVSYVRQRRGWQIREHKGTPRMLSQAEAIKYARRINERLRPR